MTKDRLERELALLRTRFPDLVCGSDASWVLIPHYDLPALWSLAVAPVCFQIPSGFPGTPPYGFYVPAGIRYEGKAPGSYTEPAATKPPFDGAWGFMSWAPEDGHWHATATAETGSNLLNWVQGFAQRFAEGA